MEVLWRKRSADVSELAGTATFSQVPASSSAATASTYKSELGRDIVEDYKLVKIGQSTFFTGVFPSCEINLSFTRMHSLCVSLLR